MKTLCCSPKKLAKPFYTSTALLASCSLVAGITGPAVSVLAAPVQNETSRVVISEIKLGGGTNTTQPKEFVNIFNGGASPLDLTGWTLQYAKPTFDKQFCAAPDWQSHSQNGSASSTALSGSIPANYTSQAVQRSLTDNTSGSLQLVDANGLVRDTVGWGPSAACSRGLPASIPPNDSSLKRLLSCDGSEPVNSGDNTHDFMVSSHPYPGILSGDQDPSCQLANASNATTQDTLSAPTIPAATSETTSPAIVSDFASQATEPATAQTQTTIVQSSSAQSASEASVVPDPGEVSSIGAGTQPTVDTVPTSVDDANTSASSDGSAPQSISGNNCSAVSISELLPNPEGSDAGHEFIELYNPTNTPISLAGCQLKTSANSKIFVFKSSDTIPANTYKAYFDDVTGLTLANASGGTVTLSGSDSSSPISVPYPEDMKDNQAWALIDGTWQYETIATPDAANQADSNIADMASMPQSTTETDATTTTYTTANSDQLVACKAGQERNSLTNRCRTISAIDTDTACRSDQERNPATNRCRTIVAAPTASACEPGKVRSIETNRCKAVSASTARGLAACKAGQVRNTATNRCRAAGSGTTNSPKACSANQVRNPVTNRCKKSLTGTASVSAVKDLKAPENTGSSLRWLLLGLTVLAALGYAAYEWRYELLRYFARLKTSSQLQRRFSWFRRKKPIALS